MTAVETECLRLVQLSCRTRTAPTSKEKCLLNGRRMNGVYAKLDSLEGGRHQYRQINGTGLIAFEDYWKPAVKLARRQERVPLSPEHSGHRAREAHGQVESRPGREPARRVPKLGRWRLLSSGHRAPHDQAVGARALRTRGPTHAARLIE